MKQTIILLMALLAPLVHSKEPVMSEEIVTVQIPCYNTKALFDYYIDTFALFLRQAPSA